ncbi:MAG: class I tRNA ligase family protein [Patescibacteria group bacterium]
MVPRNQGIIFVSYSMINQNLKFYITTSLVYTNALPHLGFALEVVQADVLARYHQFLGEDVYFLTGTDEHGAKIAKSAEKEGKNPKKFVDEISEKVRELKEVLNLSNKDFIRTTDQERHWPIVKKVWLKLKENGDIYKKKYEGPYCSGCEAFITKKDLINGKCIIHQKEPEIIKEENYFFRLSKYSNQIGEIIEKEVIKITPQSRKKELSNFIKQGLEDISFSRSRKDLQWGIPVPDDDTQTIYVWADALVNYISAIGYTEEDEKFKRYWPADIHCIGKDILKFHGTIWLGMLLSLGLSLPKSIFVHGFITVDGQKMSKSLGNVADPFEIVKKYGADAVRYFLLAEFSAVEDGDFSLEKIKVRYNADLANGLGNFAARVLALQPQSSEVKLLKIDKDIERKIEETKKIAAQKIEEFKFNESLSAIWSLIAFGDKYINQTQVWKIADLELKNQIILNLTAILNSVTVLLGPFMPETSVKITQLKKGEILFPRL